MNRGRRAPATGPGMAGAVRPAAGHDSYCENVFHFVAGDATMVPAIEERRRHVRESAMTGEPTIVSGR